MEDCDGEVNDDSKISNSCGNLGIFSGRHPERFAIYFHFLFFFLAGRNDAMSRLLFDVQLKNQELVLQTMCKFTRSRFKEKKFVIYTLIGSQFCVKSSLSGK